jgi:hypothetical protein
MELQGTKLNKINNQDPHSHTSDSAQRLNLQSATWIRPCRRWPRGTHPQTSSVSASSRKGQSCYSSAGGATSKYQIRTKTSPDSHAGEQMAQGEWETEETNRRLTYLCRGAHGLLHRESSLSRGAPDQESGQTSPPWHRPISASPSVLTARLKRRQNRNWECVGRCGSEAQTLLMRCAEIREDDR